MTDTDNLTATTPPAELDAHAWVANMVWANEELLKQRKQLRAEVLRLRDELDCAESSGARARTAWHDLVAERDAALAERDQARARITDLEAERDQALPPETPFTENLACNLMTMPSLGSGRAAVTILDTRDGQIVKLSGVYLGTGIRRVAETPSHPLYNELTVKLALVDPAPGEDVPYPVTDDATTEEPTS